MQAPQIGKVVLVTPLSAQACMPGRPSGAAKEKKQTEAGDGPRADALDPRIGAAGRRSGGERLEQTESSKTVERSSRKRQRRASICRRRRRGWDHSGAAPIMAAGRAGLRVGAAGDAGDDDL